MKVLLFATSFELNTQMGEGGPYPLGIAYIASYLEKEGHEAKAYDFLFEDWNLALPQALDIIREEKPDIVGISSMTTNRISSFSLAKNVKKLNPDIKIILGGVHPTLMYEQILQNLPVDFIVLGEGEETTAELVKYIQKNKPIQEFKKIKGIAFKYKEEVIKTESRGFLRNLDSLPFPKHECFRNKIEREKIAYVAASRGCPIGCTFCSTCLHWGRLKRQRSVKSVIEELKYLKKNFPALERIYFQDDEFIMNSKWTSDFCDAKIKEKIGLTFECCGRVSSINELLVKKLKKAGCTQINFGVESGSQRIIDLIKKRITLTQIISAFDICKKYDLNAGIYLIVGLPGENSKSINETIKLLKRVRNAKLDLPSLFQIYPGTEIYESIKKKGFIEDSYWLSDKIAPFYTLEHSKKKLFLWALEISLFSKYYKGTLKEFILSKLKYNLAPKVFAKQVKKYF